MSLIEQIDTDLEKAMRDKDEVTRSTLRLLKASLKNTAIAQGKDLDEKEVITIIQREIKQRREAATQFRQANRLDLAEKEEGEIVTLQKYLPAQLSDEEISKIVSQAIEQVSATSPQDMGKVMSVVMPQVQGRADGSRVSSIVQEHLRHG